MVILGIERSDDHLGRDIEPRHASRFGLQPLDYLVQLPRSVDDPVEFELRLVGNQPELTLQEMEQGRADLHLAREDEIEVFLRRATWVQDCGPKKHGRSRRAPADAGGPRRQCVGDEERLDAALLVVLKSLLVDRASATSRILQALGIWEELGLGDRPAFEESLHVDRLAGREIKRPYLEMAVVEKVVASAKVDELLLP
jgi:hypothetical protein